MAPPKELSVTVIDQGRTARLFVPADCDRASLSPTLIAALAQQARVRITPQVQEEIDRACAHIARHDGELTLDLAHATLPVPGAPGAWVWQPGFDPQLSTHSESSAGTTDHHASHVRSVANGAYVATLTQPTEGTDGVSVTGEALPAPRGRPANLRVGKGLELLPDGRVIASTGGVLAISSGIVSVAQVLSLPGCVDFSTGNVDFLGDVEVADAVRDGFKIRATGNVTIHGDVEGAEIACAGGLTCRRGIASSRRARVVVGGATSIAFARNVSAILRGDFSFKGELEHCDITVGGRCSGEAGRVIGGILLLTGPAAIGTLGSPDWTPTLVCVGELPLIAMDLRRLNAELARLQKAIAGKEEESRLLTLGGLSKGASARERLTELEYERSELQKEAAAISLQVSTLREAESASRGAELVVERIAHPKVRLQHGQHAFELTRDLRGPLRFSVDEHRTILVRISTQLARPLSEFAQRVHPTPLGDNRQEPARRAA
ncbi:MAG: DUF342 domain-containing protein [Leptolyngbya sp. PLA1]|nr:DUF342 domain-containing protein [Leptolyngbya sp. PLA1]